MIVMIASTTPVFVYVTKEINMSEHIIIKLIKLKEKAIKSKAHKKIISNIQDRISKETKLSLDIMRKSEFISNILQGS